jgi:hypothetical protein
MATIPIGLVAMLKALPHVIMTQQATPPGLRFLCRSDTGKAAARPQVREPMKRTAYKRAGVAAATICLVVGVWFLLKKSHKVSFQFLWYDMWAGAFWDQKKRVLYVCPLPCCVFRFERQDAAAISAAKEK